MNTLQFTYRKCHLSHLNLIFLPKQLIQATSKGEEDQYVQYQPLGDVNDHLAKRNLSSNNDSNQRKDNLLGLLFSNLIFNWYSLAKDLNKDLC